MVTVREGFAAIGIDLTEEEEAAILDLDARWAAVGCYGFAGALLHVFSCHQVRELERMALRIPSERS